MATERRVDNPIVIDRLALSRAQHLKSRNNRSRSVSEDENDAISDWSESDLECSPLSDFESTSNIDGTTTDGHCYGIPFDDDNDSIEERLPTEPVLLENVVRLNDTPLPVIHDSIISTRTSFSRDVEKPKQQEQPSIVTVKKPAIQTRRQPQTPLLPARRLQNRQQASPRHVATNSHILSQPTNLSYNYKTIPSSPSRLYLRRGTISTNTSSNTQSTKECTLSSNSSLHSSEDNQSHQRHIATSPNLSQSSTTNDVVSRIYEVKKLYVDDYDYGRLSNVSAIKTIPPRSRQKWGTIVHPPFPLGYQQIPPEQLTQAVERLASPVRCRDRHTPVQTPSKRYLSVEETEALISRLTKVKPIRTSDQYWPVQQQSRFSKTLSNALNTNNNWKGVGISA